MSVIATAVQASVRGSFWAQPRLILPDVYALPVMLDREDIARVLETAKGVTHHDDDGHHIGKEKSARLAWVAQKIWPRVSGLRNGSYGVDPMMKLYRLEAGAGEVHRHTDQDFKGPDGTQARDSIIVYLNDDYAGGETIFNGTQLAPHGEPGSGLFFSHNIPHEGRKVERGTKYVLKTDLFTLPC